MVSNVKLYIAETNVKKKKKTPKRINNQNISSSSRFRHSRPVFQTNPPLSFIILATIPLLYNIFGFTTLTFFFFNNIFLS